MSISCYQPHIQTIFFVPLILKDLYHRCVRVITVITNNMISPCQARLFGQDFWTRFLIEVHRLNYLPVSNCLDPIGMLDVESLIASHLLSLSLIIHLSHHVKIAHQEAFRQLTIINRTECGLAKPRFSPSLVSCTAAKASPFINCNQTQRSYANVFALVISTITFVILVTRIAYSNERYVGRTARGRIEWTPNRIADSTHGLFGSPWNKFIYKRLGIRVGECNAKTEEVVM